ncbi:MAG TPA: TRAP transporter TatT component family protein [Pyrinomonadaceae bacterium]|jgi:tetratricopeptide (TPR) repeat protein
MKHEELFRKVRKLIDEREVTDANLEAARDELFALVEEDQECAWAYGLLAEINYWLGESAEDAADKLAFFEEGVECGEAAIGIDENSLEGNFWLAVNRGSFGQEKGIMESLAMVQPVKRAAEKAAEIDGDYFYGGPWRVLGRLYHKAPGFPISVGSTKKAIECLEKAVAAGPKFFLNRLFLAEAYISNRDKAKAREQLEWILAAPPNENHEREDEDYKRRARELVQNL